MSQRTIDELTVVLAEDDAELINAEVTAGDHDTFDDALHYVLTRGFAEIKRARDSQAKAQAAKELQKTRESLNKLLASDPKLAMNPDIIANFAKQLGLNIPAAAKPEKQEKAS